MIPGESLHSALPWDIPWWAPDHTIFFGVFYLILGTLGAAVTYAVIKAYVDTVVKPKPGHGSH